MTHFVSNYALKKPVDISRRSAYDSINNKAKKTTVMIKHHTAPLLTQEMDQRNCRGLARVAALVIASVPGTLLSLVNVDTTIQRSSGYGGIHTATGAEQ